MLKKIKERMLNIKIWIINIVILLSVSLNTNIIFGAQYFYKDIGFLHQYLILSDFMQMLTKGLGNLIYDGLSSILDGCYTAYASISQFDIVQNVNVQTLLRNLDKLVYSVFFVIFLIAIVCKMLKVEAPLKVLGNAFACFVAVVLFSTLLTLGTTFKNATIKDIDVIVNNGDYTLSQTLYAQNTVDILKSLVNKEVTYLNVKNMEYMDETEVVKKAYLYDKPRLDEMTGEVVYEELSDGFFFTGVGEIRYYRYNTDFWTVNCTIVASTIVYLLAMLKHGFLLVDWFLINVFGKFGIGRGMFNIENIGKVGKSISDNLLAQVILYAMMSLFSIYMSATMTSELHWIAKTLLIYAFGMTVFVGSDFINKGLGIGDNFGKVAGAMFTTSRMTKGLRRGVKKLFGGVAGYAGEKVKDFAEDKLNSSYDKMSQDYQDKMDKAMNSDEFKSAMHEGKEDDDIKQAKEKMQESDYNNDIKERAKQDLYGDDYKVQEEKDKIRQGEQKAQANDQAKRELFGDDYKLQEEKSKLVQGAEHKQNLDQAKKDLYGDDYKLQEEKSKLVQGAEQEKNVAQAKKDLYGDNYKYKEVKQDVIEGEERGELKDKAMRELHGDDYKEKKMKRDIETSLQHEEMKEQIKQERTSSVEQPHEKMRVDDSEDNADELNSLLDKLWKGEL